MTYGQVCISLVFQYSCRLRTVGGGDREGRGTDALVRYAILHTLKYPRYIQEVILSPHQHTWPKVPRMFKM